MRKLKTRRRISMTSLIDVIFLLLLFFMLSSTFSRFAEVELSASGAGGGQASADQRPLFLQLGTEAIQLNGQEVPLEALPVTLRTLALEQGSAPVVLVALREGVSAQRLTDLLVKLRGVPDLQVTVLEAA